MTDVLWTANFLKNARGLTIADSATVTWTFNKSTNTLTATGSGGGGPTAANPTAKVGSTVVNGSAATFMRSDAAPPIDLTATYSWTNVHTFTAPATSFAVKFTGNSGVTSFTGNTKLGVAVLGATGATDYAGIDFPAQSGTNIGGRIAVIATGGGSKMSFGTSNNYSTGVTNTALSIDLDGGLEVAAPTGASKGSGTVNVAAGYYINGSPVGFTKQAGWNAVGAAVVPASTVAIDVLIPYACTLKQVYIMTQGGTGSCTVTCKTAAFPTTPSTDITGGTPPAIASATSYSNSTLSGWTTAFAQGDLIRFQLTANTTFTSVTIYIRAQ